MNKLLPACALLVGMYFTLASCTEDGQPQPATVPENVLAQFSQSYPNAQNVSWSQNEEGYYVATFSTTASTRNAAWYESDGTWGMTEYEIPFAQLPEAVLTAFNASAYGQGSGWTPDNEADKLERRDGSETIYVIEAEKGDSEVDLFYTADGILTKEIMDAGHENDYSGYLPQDLSGSISQWLDDNYPGARIVEIDHEGSGYEVEFIANNRKIEAYFNASQQCVYTKTDLNRRDYEDPALIPAAVKATLEASEAMKGGAYIDDIELYTVYQGSETVRYFHFELETRFGDETQLFIKEDGTEERPDLGGNTGGNPGISVDGDIEKFITDNYPGAMIIERDYDDGYLEVEIRHDGTIKEVKFNGRNEWIRTEWETRELPAAVRQAIENEGYRISDDEYDRVEAPDRKWYEVEAWKNGEWKLYVDDNGSIFNRRADD